MTALADLLGFSLEQLRQNKAHVHMGIADNTYDHEGHLHAKDYI